ncbi:hypothetical protein BDK51DRAFT_41416 [Blyttiomyces helicus]|uniref:Uncharacterized protein n=1 Tax=Blyttiomyces helicus TaxID=388810 RepID=A0A4P9W4M8_9FUNG|nr:hypothetical protein BDK51DRAFT_41416 [Blyttiomyces helicus]|eukprot:RKO86243.1 hypothetical protein BDK51DRAFT_41416 [Blyttiomyces helicus]
MGAGVLVKVDGRSHDLSELSSPNYHKNIPGRTVIDQPGLTPNTSEGEHLNHTAASACPLPLLLDVGVNFGGEGGGADPRGRIDSESGVFASLHDLAEVATIAIWGRCWVKKEQTKDEGSLCEIGEAVLIPYRTPPGIDLVTFSIKSAKAWAIKSSHMIWTGFEGAHRANAHWRWCRSRDRRTSQEIVPIKRPPLVVFQPFALAFEIVSGGHL